MEQKPSDAIEEIYKTKLPILGLERDLDMQILRNYLNSVIEYLDECWEKNKPWQDRVIEKLGPKFETPKGFMKNTEEEFGKDK